jgi:hypothetical protein
MGIPVRVTVLAPDDVLRDYGAGALIRLERADTQSGSYAEVETEPVVPRTYSYEIFDEGGANSSWYRVRYSTATPAVPDDYSAYGDPFSLSQPQAYASLDDLLITMRQDGDSRFAANAERRLVEAARSLDREIGFGVSPGIERTVVFDGDGSDRIHIHGGFVSVSLVEIRLTAGGDWVPLEAEGTGWILEGEPGEIPVADGEPYFHIALLPGATYARLPRVRAGVRVTLVPGWPAVPDTWRAANVAWARQMLAADPLVAGSIQSDLEQSPYAPDRKPQLVWDLIQTERHRHWCHL